MATSRIGVPSDPALKRAHLAGLNSGLQGWTDLDVANARPSLSPWRDAFDGARQVGLSMAKRNNERKAALQQGRPGLVYRAQTGVEEKRAKDTRLQLP